MKYIDKGKVFPVLFLTKYRAMKAYRGSGGIAPRILHLTLGGVIAYRGEGA